LAKLSKAIRDGQQMAREAGKRIGRPEVPASIRRQIEVALASGCGVRPTAKRFGVAAATVVNIRQAMAQPLAEVA
jgi:DNA invertase Pin-like site-specific DNA recombinase